MYRKKMIYIIYKYILYKYIYIIYIYMYISALSKVLGIHWGVVESISCGWGTTVFCFLHSCTTVVCLASD